MWILGRSQGGYHARDILRRAGEFYHDEGLVSLFTVGFEFITYWITVGILRAYYPVRYGAAAPRPGERLSLDPADIEWVMGRDMPDGTPPFGVVSGDWDHNKVHRFEYGEMWNGLIERFQEGKAWPETRYYRTGLERLENGITLRVLDEEDQTREVFEDYLVYLDDVFASMQREGFDPSAPVPVNVGRNGELILYADGNHRTTLAQAAELESIPACIMYRHEEWQAIRQEINEADRLEQLSEKAARQLDHPDVEHLISARS